MTRRTRMILVVLLAPVAATIGVVGGASLLLSLIGITFPAERVQAGAIFHFVFWQALLVWWLWKNWKNPHQN